MGDGTALVSKERFIGGDERAYLLTAGEGLAPVTLAHNVGSRDDSEVMELVQHVLTVVPEMEWLDVSRGMVRQKVDPTTGVITSNKTDDTAIRGAYGHWKHLMSRDVRTSVV